MGQLRICELFLYPIATWHTSKSQNIRPEEDAQAMIILKFVKASEEIYILQDLVTAEPSLIRMM